MSNQIELAMNKATDASLEGTVITEKINGGSKKKGKLTLAPPASATAPAADKGPAPAQTPAPPAPAPAQTPSAMIGAALAPAATGTPAPAATGTDKPDTNSLDYMPDVLLTQILSTKRAHSSPGDMKFRLWLFAHLKSLGAKPEVQVEGNILVETDPKSTILFSCHVDTVHNHKESDGSAQQSLSFDPTFGHLFLSNKKDDSCLGGDDGVGVWMMINMIKAKVPGRYLFHTGEERGGIGSKAFLAKNKAFFNDIEAVVAFDRAVQDGKNPEVICTQGGQRCASDVFGNALATALNKANPDFDFPYVVGHGGTFTDSKTYAMDVPECVNIGCFYARQHTANEYVDCYGLDKLMAAVLKVDWKMLPIDRNPAKSERPYGQYTGSGYSSGFERDAQRELDEYYGVGGGRSAAPTWKPPAAAPAAQPAKAAAPSQRGLFRSFELLEDLTYEELLEWVENDSSKAAFAIAGLLAKARGLETQVDMLEKMMDV